MTPMTPRERRLVAVALLVGAFAIVWFALVQPLAAGFVERAEQREQLAEQYSRNARLIARIPALRRTAEAQMRDSAAYAIVAPGVEQASERLKERLVESLRSAGGELRAAESVEGRPGWVRASVTAVIGHEQLVDWLARLTNETPYLAMESLTVGADRALNSNRPDLLDVKLEASIPFVPARPR